MDANYKKDSRYLSLVKKLENLGYSSATRHYVAHMIYREWYGSEKDKYSLADKIWAYKRGFTAEMAKTLGLNDNNYKDYISVMDYHLLDPIDPITKRLIDGKLTMHYSLGGKFPNYVPRYYAWVNENGVIVHLDDDGTDDSNNLATYLANLVERFGAVAIKPLTGTCGIGFLKLEKQGNSYFANNVRVNDFSEQAPLVANQYVITEYIDQCDEFKKIWDDSVATLRVISINDGTKGPVTFVSYVRFGTHISKGACNLGAGGVAAPFDWSTGKFFGNYYRYATHSENGKFLYDKHPDSGVGLNDVVIPHFDKVKECVETLSRYLAVHKYFGYDIIIGNEDVKICEINSLPSLDYEQLMFGGIWKRNDAVSAFFRQLLRKKKEDVDEPIVIVPDEFMPFM